MAAIGRNRSKANIVYGWLHSAGKFFEVLSLPCLAQTDQTIWLHSSLVLLNIIHVCTLYPGLFCTNTCWQIFSTPDIWLSDMSPEKSLWSTQAGYLKKMILPKVKISSFKTLDLSQKFWNWQGSSTNTLKYFLFDRAGCCRWETPVLFVLRGSGELSRGQAGHN